MSLPEPEEIERLAIGDLRSLVTSLLAEVLRLRAENAALREEIARLKGLPPRPKLKPSGMEQASEPPAPQPSGKPKRKRRRGAKRDRLVVGEERVLAAAGADRVALQGLSGHRRPGSDPGAAGDPLSPGALADAGRAHGHRPAAGRDRRWLRPGAAPVRPGRPCPGPGDQRAADRPARGHRHCHLEATGGAAADRSARRFRGRGPGGAARGSGERALDQRRRHRRPPRRAQRCHHADRRRPVHRLPHQPVEVAHELPRLPARRPRPTTWSTRRRWPTCAGTIWPAR